MLVEHIQDLNEDGYLEFLNRIPDAMIFHNPQFVKAIGEVVGGTPAHLVVRDDFGNIQGAILAFEKHVAGIGTVVNAEPFFGGHGGVLCADGLKNTVKPLLIEHYFNRAKNIGAFAASLVTSPFETEAFKYEAAGHPDAIDDRIAQLTPLPENASDLSDELLRAKLFSLFHSKTRNMVRKARGQGFHITARDDNEAWDFLTRTHQENMEVIGGEAKPESFFQNIRNHCKENEDYKVYIVDDNGVPIAGILVFFCNQVADYYTPVIVSEARSKQPLSLAIYHALFDATRRGCKWWNWGGTPTCLDNVYRFKKRWAAVDMQYAYYIRKFPDRWPNCKKERVVNAFPYFYIYPYSQWPVS